MSAAANILTSNSSDWLTPPDLAERIRELGSGIALDPCANRQGFVKATVEWHGPPGVDGLDGDWVLAAAGGLVFVNPPYGRGLCDWTGKVLEEANRGAEIALLLPARTDTAYWKDVIHAQEICFIWGRLRFHAPGRGPVTSATFPSVLAYFGEREGRFRRIFGELGWMRGAR